MAHSTINVLVTMQQTLFSSHVETGEKTIQFELKSMKKEHMKYLQIKARNLKACHDHCSLKENSYKTT
jgi:hypothetical protein